MARKAAYLGQHRVQVVAVVIHCASGQMCAVGNTADQTITFRRAPSAGHPAAVKGCRRYATGESHPTQRASGLLELAANSSGLCHPRR